MRRSWGIAACLTAGLALAAPGTALAQEAPTTTPAGDGSASAVAAEIEGVAAAGETEARAGQNDAEATANALSLGGEPPSEQFGGSTKSDGDSDASGGLLDTGDTPLGRLQLTPWEAHTRSASATNGNCRTAQGRAAVARLTLIDKDTLDVNLLQSQSDARHCGLKSFGAASSDGATVALGGEGGLLLTLLHTDVATDDDGNTYLVSINDNEILTGEQAGGQCALEVPGLLGLTCLTVGGGEGTVFADVASLTLGEGALDATLVGATGSPDKSGGASVLPETIEPAPSTGDNGLARTGVEVAGLTLLGCAGIVIGELLRRRAASRVPAA
jgi:hypothetical protein